MHLVHTSICRQAFIQKIKNEYVVLKIAKQQSFWSAFQEKRKFSHWATYVPQPLLPSCTTISFTLVSMKQPEWKGCLVAKQKSPMTRWCPPHTTYCQQPYMTASPALECVSGTLVRVQFKYVGSLESRYWKRSGSPCRNILHPKYNYNVQREKADGLDMLKKWWEAKRLRLAADRNWGGKCEQAMEYSSRGQLLQRDPQSLMLVESKSDLTGLVCHNRKC